MNRRNFVKTMSVASVLGAGSSLLNNIRDTRPEIQELESKTFDDIAKSVKANFGEGFNLQAYERQDKKILARVEHLENYYVISSSNIGEWRILSSSVS